MSHRRMLERIKHEGGRLVERFAVTKKLWLCGYQEIGRPAPRWPANNRKSQLRSACAACQRCRRLCALMSTKTEEALYFIFSAKGETSFSRSSAKTRAEFKVSF